MLSSSKTLLREVTVASKVAELVSQVHAHAAWRGQISLVEAEALLKGHLPYTVVLSQGNDEYHYVLSYVGADATVYHKNVRILKIHGSWIFKNGGASRTFAQLDALIPDCLGCSAEVCKSLR